MPVKTRSKTKADQAVATTVSNDDSTRDQASGAEGEWIEDVLDKAAWLWVAPLLVFFVLDMFFMKLSHIEKLIGFHPMAPVVWLMISLAAVRLAVVILGKLGYPVEGLFFSPSSPASNDHDNDDGHDSDDDDSDSDDDDKEHAE